MQGKVLGASPLFLASVPCTPDLREDWFEEECLKQLPWMKEERKGIEKEEGREKEQAGREGEVESSTVTEKGRAMRPCRVLYLFSGASRKGSFGEELRKRAGRSQLPLVVTEMDTLNAKRKHNFLRPQVREQVLRQNIRERWTPVWLHLPARPSRGPAGQTAKAQSLCGRSVTHEGSPD